MPWMARYRNVPAHASALLLPSPPNISVAGVPGMPGIMNAGTAAIAAFTTNSTLERNGILISAITT
jgi:hypothetical protein